MCTVCGCGGEARIENDGQPHGNGRGPGHDHNHEHGHIHGLPHDHAHDHDHDHDHHHDHAGHAGSGDLDYGAGPAGAHAPGVSQSRMVRIEQDILAKNAAFAAENRARFSQSGVLALNLVSSPGSGKTSLLAATIERLKGETPVAVIEGDQQTSNDAARIRAAGAPAIQINTGKGCHLDAHMVGHAVSHLEPESGAVLFIENVGNLVCPASFDLGEAHRVVLLSVTEGEDKPLKYPEMIRSSHLLLISKVDLLPHLDFDVDALVANARAVNPSIKALKVSARTGEGMEDWLTFIRSAQVLARIGI
jgi:hydrogenase nickel incorporation protein HypB